MSCIFCRIINSEIPADFVYQDEVCVAFRDINPVAPTHILVVPRQHFAGLNEAAAQHAAVLGHTLQKCGEIARAENIEDSGYRTVINTGADAQQSVPHLHIHLLGGRSLGWPPG